MSGETIVSTPDAADVDAAQLATFGYRQELRRVPQPVRELRGRVLLHLTGRRHLFAVRARRGSRRPAIHLVAADRGPGSALRGARFRRAWQPLPDRGCPVPMGQESDRTGLRLVGWMDLRLGADHDRSICGHGIGHLRRPAPQQHLPHQLQLDRPESDPHLHRRADRDSARVQRRRGQLPRTHLTDRCLLRDHRHIRDRHHAGDHRFSPRVRLPLHHPGHRDRDNESSRR